jgi:hypothetical protein
VDHRNSKRTGDGRPARGKAEWTAPQVDKLVAGGAEASAGADVEGLDGLS